MIWVGRFKSYSRQRFFLQVSVKVSHIVCIPSLYNYFMCEMKYLCNHLLCVWEMFWRRKESGVGPELTKSTNSSEKIVSPCQNQNVFLHQKKRSPWDFRTNGVDCEWLWLIQFGQISPKVAFYDTQNGVRTFLRRALRFKLFSWGRTTF